MSLHKIEKNGTLWACLTCLITPSREPFKKTKTCKGGILGDREREAVFALKRKDPALGDADD